MKKIDLDNWNRKEHFLFFSSFANPQLNITTEVDCTKTYQIAKKQGHSLFASYFHKSIKAINATKEFKYRIINGEVYELDVINVGSTIARPDGTFAFGYIPFTESFDEFAELLKEEIKAIHQSTGLRANDDAAKIELVRYTTLPWFSFTGIMHPSKYDRLDSVPKIAFGKIIERNGKYFLPISIEAHHGLVDGFHVAQYLETFQKYLNEDS